MSKYDFDKITDRKGTNSLKWNVSDGVLPMWVADMDFAVCPDIQDAIKARAQHPIFGYSVEPAEWSKAYIDWWGERHDTVIKKDMLLFSTGVIPTISTTVRRIAAPGEGVIVMTPVYNVFFNCINNSERRVVENPLKYDAESMRYDIDFEDLEAKAALPDTKLLLLCNPQNPAGRIWTREELARIGDICKANGVMVLSDEIHCDLTLPGVDYVPFMSASDTCKDISITAIAPSKTFNIAGLQSSAVVVPNRQLRRTIWNGLNADEVGEGNCFACDAAIAAFTKGGQWLDELREYIAENKRIAVEFINNNVTKLRATVSDATYLLWVDTTALTPNSDKLALHLKDEAKLFVTRGGAYGGNGEGFLRINLACPRSVLMDGLERLKAGVDTYNE